MRPKPRITRYIGLSTDTKPNADWGDTFREMDTGTVFMFDGETWHALSTEHEFSGDIVSFKARKVVPMQSVVVSMEPIQDLNGYDHPWPAGGGKNKFDPAIFEENGGVLQTDGSYYFSTVSQLLNKVAWDSGGYDGQIAVTLIRKCEINRQTLRLCINYTDGTKIKVGANYATGNFDTYTVASDASKTVSSITFDYGTNYPTYAKVQVELGSTATSYEPYSNICPISGRTGLSVFVGPTAEQADATTYAVDWESEAGTVYGGTLDVVTGELVVDRAMVRPNTANMNNNNDYPGWRALAELPGIVGARVNTPVPATLNIGGSAVGVNTTAVTSGILYLPVGVYKKSQDEWKALAMDIEILLYYATPITYHLTPQEVRTLLGQNNVWSDAGDVTVKVKF